MNSIFLLFFFISYTLAACPTDLKCENSFNKCYKFIADENGYIDAEENCQQLGGHLVSIKNVFENQLVLETAESMFTGYTAFWTGGNYFLKNGWSWTDGTPFVYTNWLPGEPLLNQAVSVNLTSGFWSGSNSLKRFPYICELPYSMQSITTQGIPTVAPTCKPCKPIALCDDGWTHFQGSCYRVFKFNKNFVDAEQFCQQNKAHLTSIHSTEENSFVNDLAATGVPVNTGAVTWIGLFKASAQWHWTDNTPFDYANWCPAQPDSGSGHDAQNCVQTFPDGANRSFTLFPAQHWDDMWCDWKLMNFICKKSANN